MFSPNLHSRTASTASTSSLPSSPIKHDSPLIAERKMENISVIVRVRPPFEEEKTKEFYNIWTMDFNRNIITLDDEFARHAGKTIVGEFRFGI